MLFQIKTGSEIHATEQRGAMVTIGDNPIFKVLTPIDHPEWEPVGNKGRHGRWCTAVYDIAEGTELEFIATANGRENIQQKITVKEGEKVEIDGYIYNGSICGWILSL